MICLKSMNSKEGCASGFRDAFYGSATMGERGQIVIPAEARAEMDMKPGEKLLIMKHPAHPGLMLFKIDAVQEFLDDFQATINRLSEDA
jgi:AbrB family looped-hinge helix DNA binding protein